MVTKYRIYEQFGVQEYWIVHPYNESLAIYSLKNGKYEQVESSIVLPGIEINLNELFS
jgi:Uma2 family endonuclease